MTSPSLRVWRAPLALLDLLVDEALVPRHADEWNEVDEFHRSGVVWMTAHSADWHTDWPEVFSYFVGYASPRATLFAGDDRARLRRGDLIQLWPMTPHRLVGWASAVSIDTGIRRWRFPSRKTTEATFFDLFKGVQ